MEKEPEVKGKAERPPEARAEKEPETKGKAQKILESKEKKTSMEKQVA